MKFEWSADKNRINQSKHGVSVEEAVGVFAGDDLALEMYDEAHSVTEDRFITIGPIQRGLVLVVWTERLDEIIRVISARWATPSEQRMYLRHMEHRR